MAVDANKTGETRRVTELAAMWLGERGFKPVETEFNLIEAGSPTSPVVRPSVVQRPST